MSDHQVAYSLPYALWGLCQMPLTSLWFTNVGPFDEVTLEFDGQVNLFIGPNNCGKSTLLWVLGELLVYPFTMPSKLLRSGDSNWRLGVSSSESDAIEGHLPAEVSQLVQVYERIGYTCYVPAQRHGTNFRSPGPTAAQDIESRLDEELDIITQERPTAFSQIGAEDFRRTLRGSRALEGPELARRRKLMLTGTSLVSDKAVKQKIVDLDYAAYRLGKPAIRDTIAKVASMASEITEGFPIQFSGVAEDSEGLFPQYGTPDGDLPLDVLSQGTQSIIQFLARFLLGYAEYYSFPPDLEDKPGVLMIDEIDAHLHPNWQRRVIPTLTRNFPNLQIFCSSHSPLMLAGLKTGQVQLLRREENDKVTVSENETDIAGWTADEILRHFMDVSSPTDAATADRVNRLRELRQMEELSDAQTRELEQLRHTISEDLLSGPMSAQVLQFAEKLKRAEGTSNPLNSGATGDGEGFRD